MRGGIAVSGFVMGPALSPGLRRVHAPALGLLALSLALAVPAAAAGRPRTPSEWRAWEARKATIAEIVIHIQPVFDETKPSEDTWLGRTANRIHKPTREPVIRRALLFKEGDRVVAQDVYQTERILRALAFIKDARIVPEALKDGGVRAHVWVRDAWTLEVDAGFQQTGGQRTMHTGIEDQNFLGTGKTVGFSLSKDHERTESRFSYRDPQFLGSHWKLDTDYQVLTDGKARSFALTRPFFALNTPWSVTAEAATRESRLLVYDEGKSIFEAPFRSHAARLGGAWAIRQEDDRVWRAGLSLVMDDRRYGGLVVPDSPSRLPPPLLEGRRQRGPALTLAYQQEGYQSFQDLRGMDVPEDYNLAWEGTLEVGSYTRRLGSTLPGPFLNLHLAKGWSGSAETLTLFEGNLHTRSGGIEGENRRLDASLSTYVQVKPTYQVAGYLGVGLAHRVGPEHIQYLGANEGLRGYPNYLHPGDAHWILSLENRLFTEQRWFGLFRAGYVAFVDAGSVRRMDGEGWSRIYPDLGVGLRLGDLKSSFARVLLLSVSTPLIRQPGQSRWQVGIRNTLLF